MKKCNVKLTYKQTKPIIINKLVPALYKCAYIKDFLKRESNMQTNEKLTFDHNFCSRNPQRKRNRHNLGSMRYLFNFNRIVLIMHQQTTGYFHYASVEDRLLLPPRILVNITHSVLVNSHLIQHSKILLRKAKNECYIFCTNFFILYILPVVNSNYNFVEQSQELMSISFAQIFSSFIFTSSKQQLQFC